MERKKRVLLLWLLFFFVSMISCQTKSPETTVTPKKESTALYWKPSTYTIQEPSRIYKWDLTTKKESFITNIITKEETLWTSLSPDKQKLVCAVQNDAFVQEKKYLFWTYQYYKDDYNWDDIDNVDKDSDFQSPYWIPDSSGFLYIRAMKQTQTGDFIHYESYDLMDVRFSNSKTPKLVCSFQSLISSLVWSPDQTTVAFFAQTGKEVKLWTYDIKAGVLSSLCSVEADQFSKNRIRWVDDHSLIWLEIQTLYSWDLEQKKKETVVTLPGVILGYDFYLPDSSVCLTYALSEPTEKTFCILYSWKNKKNQILASGYQVDSPRFSPDGTKISFFNRPLESEKPELVVYSLLTQKKTTVCRVGKITIYPWDANPTYAVWSPDSQLILVENKQEDDSIVQLYALSPLKLLKEIVQTDYIYSYNFSPSGEWVKVAYPQEEQTKITLYHWKSAEVIDLSGEWLGWSTEDFS
ncbi:hypothetical protein LLG10_06870 [bacterium]|nr:hypothetical protein [bacterium]